MKVVHVQRGVSAMPDSRLPTPGYVPLVQICRDDEVVVDWHVTKCCRSRSLRDEAEDDALVYASKLVERPLFDGPPSGVPVAA